MGKYKVGDRVKVRSDLEVFKSYNGVNFAYGMQDYKGKIVTISKTTTYYTSHELYYIEGLPDYVWDESMFEEIIDEAIDANIGMILDLSNWTIKYDPDGTYTLALKGDKKDMKEFKIVDYKVCDNDGVKTLVVNFEDGSREHAVCCPEDEFELARGVEVCVMKHIFGRDNYKAMLKNAMRQIKAVDKDKEEAKKEKEMITAKKASAARKKTRYKANKRKKRVAEMKEAYLAAMREYGSVDCTICETAWNDLK